jgi:hypothetical protein
MSQPIGASGSRTLVLRLSVPADDGFRGLASDIAARVAEYLGSPKPAAKSFGARLGELVAEVAQPGAGGETADIVFEFHRTERELRIEARCAGRSSEATHPLA